MFSTQSLEFNNDFLSMSGKSPSELPNAILEAISVYTDKRKKPKRNRSAFILFSVDIRKKRKDLEELNPNDRFVKIAQIWKEVSEEERKYYEDKAQEEKVKYTAELSDFCKNFPTEPIQRPRNHIKKPCNAYGYFLKDIKDQIRKESPEMRMCEVLRIVGEKWKTLSPAEKEKFEKKAEISRQNFKEEVSKQMETVKKVKVADGVGVNKVKSPEPQLETLVCKDIHIPTFQVDSPPYLRRSTSTEKKNFRPNLSQVSQSNLGLEQLFFKPTIPNAPTLSIPELLIPQPVGQLESAPVLEALYWKVEKLRQHILLQLQAANAKRQTQQHFISFDGRLPFEDRTNRSMYTQSYQSEVSSDAEGVKKEESH